LEFFTFSWYRLYRFYQIAFGDIGIAIVMAVSPCFLGLHSVIINGRLKKLDKKINSK
jgi:hypothetical protein